ncbi:hypothetical protein AK830_g10759 [Neonectria ditissima]|uniref:CFEM domain-containing protein n=1 Tax=Neonectria ditissima TaxID=78410 RepID=A0A0P7B5A5_9HYPO|nr:hypothetical protein AK830_g10759 [Neonectria ditissima]
MKFYRSVAIALATARFAQSQSLPSCADSCVGSSSSDTTCNSFDLSCLCTNKSALSAGVCCLYDHCSDADRKQAEEYSRSICTAAGYSIPSGVACATISKSSSDAQSSATAGSDPSNTQTDSATADGTSADSLPTQSSSSDTSGDSSGGSSTTTHKKSSHTLKTGLGIGLGVGVPLIAALAGYLAFLRKKKRNANAANQQPPVSSYQVPPPQGTYPPVSGYPQGFPPQGYPPQTYPHNYPVQGPPQGQFQQGPFDAQKYEQNGLGGATNHEMLGNVPDPRQELHSNSRPHNELHSDARPPNELHSNARLPNELHSDTRPPNELP